MAPVIFALNLFYCFTVIPKEDRYFYPGRFEAYFAWLSLFVFTGMTVLAILELFGVTLFGG